MSETALESYAADRSEPSAAALWATLREEAGRQCRAEPALVAFITTAILEQPSLEAALSNYLASKLANSELALRDLRDIAAQTIAAHPEIVAAVLADLVASKARNPAYRDHLTPFLYFKGFAALQWHRINHALWQQRRFELATYLQSRLSETFAVDIHPAARFGRGVFIDHATGFVVGETATVGDNVSILHGVTLGGTGKESGDRHPKIGSGVLIGAGAKVLGNITVGECAKIGAGSVVLRPVPPHTTVAGNPARVVGPTREAVPAFSMRQDFLDFEI